MNAKEAREKALQITGDKEKSQYNSIKERIEVAVDKGELSAHYFSSLMPAVNKKLIDEGYKISSYFDQREGTMVTIKW